MMNSMKATVADEMAQLYVPTVFGSVATQLGRQLLPGAEQNYANILLLPQ